MNRLFPSQADNGYRGHRVALWLLVLLLFIKAAMSAKGLIDPRGTAMGPDGIPLDSFGPVAADTVLQMFVLLALAQLMPVLVGIAVLVRWRSLVPFAYLLLLVEQAGRRLLLQAQGDSLWGPHPIGFYVNLGILAALVIGFLLSLTGRRYA